MFVNAVLWVLRSGARWSDFPERCGKFQTVHKCFTRWAKAGVWERVFETLSRDRDNEYLMILAFIKKAVNHDPDAMKILPLGPNPSPQILSLYHLAMSPHSRLRTHWPCQSPPFRRMAAERCVLGRVASIINRSGLPPLAASAAL